MIGRKTATIGSTNDSNGRKYIAVKKSGDLIVKILASDEDRNNIKNYSSNCVTNIEFRNTNSNTLMNVYFNSYIQFISEDFYLCNDELYRFISRFVYAYRLDKLILNQYDRFIRNNVMFSYYLKVDEISENGKFHKYK